MNTLGATPTTKKEFNSTQASARIIKAAAFCFAVMSWLATAEGLHMYVFNYAWQAQMISFGVQSILFVLNLKLPYYLEQLGQHGTAGKKYRKRLFQAAISALYVAAMVFSSFFSFVYISNSVVYGHDSGYVDDNTVLTNSFQYILDDTTKYIDENIQASQIVAGMQLADLQMEMGGNENSAGTHTLQELQDAVSEAELEYQNAIVTHEDAQRICDAKYEYMQSQYGVRFVQPEKYLAAQEAYEETLNDVSEAQKGVNSANSKLQKAEQALEDWKKTDAAITSGLLVELLSDSPNPETLSGEMALLMDRVTQLGESGNIPSNFAAIVQKTQVLQTTLQHYTILREIHTADKITTLSDAMAASSITIPSPSSATFNEDRLNWQKFWQIQYGELKKLVKQLPDYDASHSEYLADNWINTNLLESYDKDQLMAQIDGLLRNCATDINVIERSVNLIRGEYPFAAIFSAIIAAFLDLSSLLAGLFLYGIAPHNTKKQNHKTEVHSETPSMR